VLFVLAQAAGIAPPISTHIQHRLENEQDIAAGLSNSGRIDPCTIIMPTTTVQSTSIAPVIRTTHVVPCITTCPV